MSKTICAGFDAGVLRGMVAESSYRLYQSYFMEYCEFAGDGISALDHRTLSRWRQHLLGSTYDTKSDERVYSVNSINNRLAAVKSIMKEAANQGYMSAEEAIRFRLVRRLDKKVAKDRQMANTVRLSRRDIQHICEQPDRQTGAGKMNYALLLTLATVGLRASEAATLRYSQIEEAQNETGAGWVVYVMGKDQADEMPVALSVAAKDAIDEWLTYRREKCGVDVDYIFTSFHGRGTRASDTPVTRAGVWHIVNRYAQMAGVENVKPHDLRRYVGTQLAKNNIRLAQKQLRHSRIDTTVKFYVLDSVEIGSVDDLI